MSVKVKKQIQKTDIDLSELNKMYNQMIGLETGNPVVMCKHYNMIYKSLISYITILNKFSDETCLLLKTFPEFKTAMGEIQEHCRVINTILEENKKSDEEEKDDMNLVATPSIQLSISNKYKNIKEAEEIQKIVVLCGNLTKYKQYIEDKKNLSDIFIKKCVGIELFLFPFSSFNFKILSTLIEELPDKTTITQYYLTVLNIIFKLSNEIYNIIIKPDIDPKEFATILIQGIKEIKKKIPRCAEAFATIEKSVDLFEQNFGEYHKDFVMSKNPTIIIESFISDVAGANKADPKLTRQFQEIIKFFQKAISSSEHKDPQVDKLFSSLQSKFDIFSEATTGKKADGESSTDVLPSEVSSSENSP